MEQEHSPRPEKKAKNNGVVGEADVPPSLLSRLGSGQEASRKPDVAAHRSSAAQDTDSQGGFSIKGAAAKMASGLPARDSPPRRSQGSNSLLGRLNGDVSPGLDDRTSVSRRKKKTW